MNRYRIVNVSRTCVILITIVKALEAYHFENRRNFMPASFRFMTKDPSSTVASINPLSRKIIFTSIYLLRYSNNMYRSIKKSLILLRYKVSNLLTRIILMSPHHFLVYSVRRIRSYMKELERMLSREYRRENTPKFGTRWIFLGAKTCRRHSKCAHISFRMTIPYP